jgi:ferrous iron transport protein A
MTSLDLRPLEVEPNDLRLDQAKLGHRAWISCIYAGDVNADGGVSADELERRLLEMGFVEGAEIEVLHMGFIGGDPIAVRLGDTRIALRRREARAIALSANPV